jgi:amino acid transporter
MAQASMTTSGKGFLRDATGLVREISFLDAYFFNMFFLNIGLGIGITFSFAPAAWPGGNIILGMVIGTIGGAINVAVWGLLSAAMPRSGTEYVTATRILHPALGFTMSWVTLWLNTFIIVMGTSLFVFDGVSPALTSIGLLLGNDAILNAAFAVFNPWPQFLIGAAAIVFFGILMAMGSRNFFALQRVLFILGVIAVVLAIILFATNTNAGFIQALEAVEGEGVYENTIQLARDSGLVEGSPSLAALLGTVAVAMFTMPWGYASASIGGEVREAHRTQPLSMILAVLTTGIVIIIAGLLIINVVGQDFLSATGHLFLIGDYDNLPLGAPYFNFFASVLTSNPLVIVLIAVGFIAWTFMWIPINILTGSRVLFAWAFDRVVPERLGDVSERFHTPVLAITLITVVALAFWAIWVVTGAFFLTSFFIASFLGLMLVSLTAIVFPYRRKELYDSSPIAQYKVAGMPLIVVLGVLNFLFYTVMEIFSWVSPNLGANTPVAIGTAVALWVTGFAVFFISKAVRKSQDDFDLNMVYQEIPPE